MNCHVLLILLLFHNLLQEERRVSLRKYQVHDETMQVTKPELCMKLQSVSSFCYLFINSG